MKKFLSAALAALLLAASAGTAVYAADVPAGEAVKGTPTIDGKIDDLWASAPVYNIDRVKDGRDTGLKSTFSAMWDDSALYVLIIAEDSDHSFEGGASVGDGMEIYMDFNNAKTMAYDDDAQAYFAMCANDAATLSYDGSPYGKMVLEDAASVAMTTEDGRYIYEAKILDEAMEVELAEGMTIGFDIQVNDQVSGETSRSGAYGWSDDINKAWESPEVFGNLTLTAGGAAAAAPAAASGELVIDPLDAPYGMNVEKTTFAYGEDIMITTWGENTNDWVGIYHAEEDSAPGGGSSSRQWFYCYMSDGEEPWNLMDGEGPYAGAPLDPGKYNLYFCFNDGYEIGKTIEITVLEDGASAEAPAAEAPAAAPAAAGAIVTDGLFANFEGSYGKANGEPDSWKDSAKGLELEAALDDNNYWTDNAFHVDSAYNYFPDEIVDLVNGEKFTVEIALGELELPGTSYISFIISDNDNFSLFNRVDGDYIEFKAAGNARPKVPGGADYADNSTLSVTFDLDSDVVLYVDGVEIGRAMTTETINADTLFLGHYDAARNWIGDVYGIRFYDRALTAEEVAQNAAYDAQFRGGAAAEAPAAEAAPAADVIAIDAAAAYQDYPSMDVMANNGAAYATAEEAVASLGKTAITGYTFVSGTEGFGNEGPENLWDGDTAT
ncbi:MAG: hypothetical protein II333_12105, partial [Clostridia bacterium]|nr:hypothetical protein [Clostridia bacterium]